MHLAATIGAAFGIAVAVSWAAAKVGVRAGLVDRPGVIKPHSRPVPFLGGTAILAAVLPVAVLVDTSPAAIAGAGLCWFVGAVDDVWGLEPVAKLLALVPPLLLGSFVLEFQPLDRCIFVLVGLFLLNAFNVIDGLDSLAGGTALLMFTGLTYALGAPPIAAAGIGATAGFLLFNLPPARMFLGDQGSLLLGYMLWVITAVSIAPASPLHAATIGALVWLLPLLNTVYVVIIRLKARRHIMRGDRSHLYDALNRRYGLVRTVTICWSLSAVGVSLAALLRGAA